MSEQREKIIAICLDVIEMAHHEIHPDDKFDSFSHIDSLRALDLVAALEMSFKIKLPEPALREFVSLNGVVAAVQRQLAA